MELIKHAQSECNAWFETNLTPSDGVSSVPPQQNQYTQAVCLQSICLVDGSWTVESHYSGYVWVWMDDKGNEQLLGLRNNERRLSPLHSKLDALIWEMENMFQHTSEQIARI